MSMTLHTSKPVTGLASPPSHSTLTLRFASALSPKTVATKHFVASATSVAKLESVFATASLEFEQMNTVASVKFVFSEEDPCPSLSGKPISKLLGCYQGNLTASSQANYVGDSISFWKGENVHVNDALLKAREENVKQVIVNLYIPLATNVPVSDAAWSHLIQAVGTICRAAFPNMDPKESALIIHRGSERYHKDEAFLINPHLI